MPPPYICLFQPRLLFPYDDYRGPLVPVALICSGVCIEALCFCLCFLWAVVCIHREASQLYWALLPLPLQSFDFFVFSYGLWRLVRSNSWLLPSEKWLRAILLSGFFFRFCLSCLFTLYMLRKVPLASLLAVSALSYITGTTLNINRRDAYTWVRLQCWDLMILLQLLTVCLSSAMESLSFPVPLAACTTSACIWPLWVLAACHLCCCMLLGLLLLRDVLLQQNTVTRVLVHVFEVHAVSFLLATVSFSQWLSARSKAQFIIFVSAAIASFFLFMILAVFACICFIARHSTALTDDLEQARGRPLGANASPSRTPSAAAATAAMAPPLVCDMKVTLERVSEHFYRIGAPLEKLSTDTASVEESSARKGRTTAEQPSTDLSPTQQQTPQLREAEKQTGQQPSGSGSMPATATAAGLARDTKSEASAAPASSAPAIVPSADAELCMICCNTQATAVLMYCGHGGLCFKCAKKCFNRQLNPVKNQVLPATVTRRSVLSRGIRGAPHMHACRTGLCPTCRRPVKGVLEVQRPNSETANTDRLQGVVRDVSR